MIIRTDIILSVGDILVSSDIRPAMLQSLIEDNGYDPNHYAVIRYSFHAAYLDEISQLITFEVEGELEKWD